MELSFYSKRFITDNGYCTQAIQFYSNYGNELLQYFNETVYKNYTIVIKLNKKIHCLIVSYD